MLTHWGRDKIATISQTTISNAFSWMKILGFRLKFHWSFFPRGRINNIPPLVQIMVWRRPGDKPLSNFLQILWSRELGLYLIWLPQKINHIPLVIIAPYLVGVDWYHNDVTKWTYIPHYWTFVTGNKNHGIVTFSVYLNERQTHWRRHGPNTAWL